MTDDVEALQAQVRAQAHTIEHLGGLVAELSDRLARLERPPRAEPVEGTRPGGEDAPPGERWSTTTDRRRLLTRAAATTAGVVAGGAALAVTQASPAAAAPGVFDGSPAVTGTASPASGTGVVGTSGSGAGVAGSSTGGVGVQGSTGSGVGVHAETAAAGVQLLLAGTPGPPPNLTAIARTAGSVVKDQNNDLWLCVADGTPGTWRRVSGANTAGALTLLATPVRIYDSRPANPPLGGVKSPLANGAIRVLDVKANGSGVPAGATAVLANVTVVNTSAAGFLTAYRAGFPTPAASTINWFQAGTVVANTTVVACDGSGQITCYVPPTSSTDFFIDVIGFTR